MTLLRRRDFLIAAGLSLPASKLAANTSLSTLPRPRPDRSAPDLLAARIAERIAKARLDGRVSFLVADTKTGAILSLAAPHTPMPPASTLKAISSAYALDHLGPAFRYRTQVLATGPIRDGVLAGDLILAGSGDPLLSTDDLAALAQAGHAAGLRSLEGRFLYWDGALPHVWEIDPAQPDHLRYNPSLSGLNVNFNRVHFGWQLDDGQYALRFDARTRRFAPQISVIRGATDQRNLPIFEHGYDPDTGSEVWSVAKSALGSAGSRLLPVRESGDFAAEIFQHFAAERDIALPRAAALDSAPKGAVLASHQSPELREILKGLLKFSTNISAEAVGMSASVARSQSAGIESLNASASAMSEWAEIALDMRDSRFVDHSGLSGLNRTTARDMVAALITLGPNPALRRVLPEITLRDEDGAPEPFKLWAKTGTLNFVSGLTGYIESAGGRMLAFAILTDAPARRAAVRPEDREAPAGTRSWSRRSRDMQYDLVRLWAEAA